MIDAMAQAQEAGEADALTASDLLALARDRKAAEDQAAAELLDLAARWADLHPPESIHAAAAFTVPGCEHEEPIAGQGCPLVAEFCIAELGTVLNISTTAAKKLIGHALELRHRLPRLWAQVHAGRVPAWRARIIAEATIHTSPALTMEAARWVDVQVSAVAGRVGTAQLDRLVAETIKRFDLAAADPATDPEDGYLFVDPRHATLHDEDVHFAGTMSFEAELDLADALDLDRAISQGAATLKALGSDDSLNARRAAALGDLARTQTALDLFSQGHGTGHGDDGLPTAREVVVHAHFDASTDGQQTVFGPTGRMEEGQRLVLLDQIKHWCGDSRTKVTIKPVIDLQADLSTTAYEIPDRIREQVVLRDRTCVFPWCTRPARRCDIDHIIEFDHDAAAEDRPQPGPTTTSNLAALCRYHHRLKTHTAWTYRMIAPGVFEWTSPHGHHYRRDRTGTTAVSPAPSDGPRPIRRASRDLADHEPAPHLLTTRRRRPVVRLEHHVCMSHPAVDALVEGLAGIAPVSDVWLTGSLAIGDHHPGASDIDLVALTAGPMTRANLDRVVNLHRHIDASDGRGSALGCAYVDLDRWGTIEWRHPTWTHGQLVERPVSPIARAELLAHGVALVGRDPHRLLPPMSNDDVRGAARAELTGYWTWAAARPWLFLETGFADLALVTMARARHTLGTGELLSKTDAVALVRAPAAVVDEIRRRRSAPRRTSPLAPRVAHHAWRDTRRTIAAHSGASEP